jgi:hypothetical protein
MIWGSHSGDYEDFYLPGYNNFQRTTRHYVPEDRTLQLLRIPNTKHMTTFCMKNWEIFNVKAADNIA